MNGGAAAPFAFSGFSQHETGILLFFCTWIPSMIVELIEGSLMLGYMGFALAMSIILIGITLERYLEPQPPPKLQKFSRKSEKME